MIRSKVAARKRIGSVLKTYLARVQAFSPNARKYLIGIMIYGAATGVYQLLFNFFILSLGYNEAVLGILVTARSATTLIVALPVGYLADRIGRKLALIIGQGAVGAAILMMVLFPSLPMFLAMNIVIGFSQSLAAVAMGPFLMENSGDVERTYLFSFSSGLRMTAVSIGEWVGGFLPTWIARSRGALPTSASAYSGALAFVSVGVALSLIPGFLIRQQKQTRAERATFAPLSYMRRRPGELTRLILPLLLTSVGAGMIMPFMNVFFRNVHRLSDASIGILFAWGSLAMGIGLLLAPALAERFGKIRVVVATQGLSIPFLALLGFSPWLAVAAVAYYVRLVLMNMSGPVYTTFTMEQVDRNRARWLPVFPPWPAILAGPLATLSGYFQVRYGFGPSFAITILFYIVSVVMYYVWFWGKRKPNADQKEAIIQTVIHQ